MGDLKILGWAIYCGVHFDKSVIDRFLSIAKTKWLSLKYDNNRTYYVVQDNIDTAKGKELWSYLTPMMNELLMLFHDIVNNTGYKLGNWSIFKNTKSSLGQPDHCDYPRAHDDTIESPMSQCD